MSTTTETLTRTSLRDPSMWTIVIHNDDFTPFDFVEGILKRYFHKTAAEAEIIAGTVHENGKARLGIFTKEIALTKVENVTKVCEEAGHPLKLTAEEA
jgi:ATP-dependent Clp protease adaptor protein ClpS